MNLPDNLVFKICYFQKNLSLNFQDFLLKKDRIEILIELTKNFVEIFNQIKIDSGCENELYIVVESLKHLIQSLIKASLQVKALSEEEISAFNLGDITPLESETMLTSLASTEKWDYVYRKLA